MLEHEEHQLDVDFEIVEDPEDSAFPRLPNVVSHRRHKVKVIATVHDLPYPERKTDITLSAKVNVLDHELINERGHISRPFQRWGKSKEIKVTFTPDEYSGFPFNIEAVVPMSEGDDHLGQGPDYEAFVDVRTSSVEPPVAGGGGGAQQRDATTNGTGPRTEGSYIIRFTAK